ncbi:MAG: translation initiation factor IF-3 [Patescibacteria group bacterium]
MHLRHRRRPKQKPELIKLARVNRFISSPEVRVIDQQGQNLGILPVAQALQIAQSAGLDLVEVNPKAEPPVCRIINYGQYRYEQEKEARKAKAKQKMIEIKGIRLSLRIKGVDLELRKSQAAEFLERGDKVKIEMVLRGREKAHMDLAQRIIDDFVASLPYAAVIQPISRMGGRISLVVGRR